jgi:hypothetical protein
MNSPRNRSELADQDVLMAGDEKVVDEVEFVGNAVARPPVFPEADAAEKSVIRRRTAHGFEQPGASAHAGTGLALGYLDSSPRPGTQAVRATTRHSNAWTDVLMESIPGLSGADRIRLAGMSRRWSAASNSSFVANSVGMAIAGRWIAAHFNRPGFEDLIDYNIYALCGERRLSDLGCQPVPYRDGINLFVTDYGNHILDCHIGPIPDAHRLELDIRAFPGVVGTGLFLGMADTVLVGDQHGFQLIEERRRGAR